MRILVLHGSLDHPDTNGRLEAAARELGVELAISRADDEDALVAAVEANADRVQGVLISPNLSQQPQALDEALRTMRVPVIEVLQPYAMTLRSMVEMLRHPDA